MAAVGGRTRSRERLERLSASGAGSEELQRETVAELRHTIGFDRWCWPSADPESLLPGPGMAEHDYGPQLPRTLWREYAGTDLATKEQAARAGSAVVALSRATSGDLARSARWDEVLRGVGIGDVAVLACRDPFGCWGWLEIYRDRADGAFSDADLGLLEQLAPILGTAMRTRSMAAADPGHADSDVEPHAPAKASVGGGPAGALEPASGVLVLGPDLRVVEQTSAADTWLASFPAATQFAAWGILQPAVYAAAARAQAGREEAARLLGRTTAGRWVQIEAAPVLETERVAVVVRAARVYEIFGAAARAHRLTGREREVAVLVAAGQDTAAIARALVISQWTVQDHLKSVFGKLGVHSRGELTARLGGEGRSA